MSSSDSVAAPATRIPLAEPTIGGNAAALSPGVPRHELRLVGRAVRGRGSRPSSRRSSGRASPSPARAAPRRSTSPSASSTSAAGDDVLVPSLTFVASVNPIVYVGRARRSCRLGARDLEPRSRARRRRARPAGPARTSPAGRDRGRRTSSATRRDRADRRGRGAARRPVIEDASEALGATYRGGPLRRPPGRRDRADRLLQLQRQQAHHDRRRRDARDRRRGARPARPPPLDPGAAARAAYDHDEVGYNYRLSNLAAALGVAQLEAAADGSWRGRRANAARYDAAIAGLPGLGRPRAPVGRPVVLALHRRLGRPPDARSARDALLACARRGRDRRTSDLDAAPPDPAVRDADAHRRGRARTTSSSGRSASRRRRASVRRPPPRRGGPRGGPRVVRLRPAAWRRRGLSSRHDRPDTRVAVVGLGYVGLPLAISFAEAGPRGRGHRRLGTTASAELNAGAVADRRRLRRAPRRRADAAASVSRPRTRHASRRPTRSSCASRRRSPRPRTRTSGPCSRPPTTSATSSARASSSSSSRRPFRGPRRVRSGRSSRRRPASPARTSTSPSRRSGSTRATRRVPHATCRAWSAGTTPAATNAPRRCSRASTTGGRLSSPDAAEMAKLLENIVPQRQHRVRQPARPAVRADGPRCLGGHRRGGDQAVRVHALHARPRGRRPLHPGRPVLPVVARPRVRLRRSLHRARRRHQPGDAAPRRRPRRRGAERPRAGDPRREGRGRRGRVQAERPGRPELACRRRHRRDRRAWRRGRASTTRMSPPSAMPTASCATATTCRPCSTGRT